MGTPTRTPLPLLPHLPHLPLLSLLLLLFVLSLSALTSAQPAGVENPLLMMQAQTRQQEKAKMELQQIQRDQLHILGGLPDQVVPRPKPHHPPHQPLHPPQQHGHAQQGGGAESRNEMHKGRDHGGPGPTPWTRWTPRPRYNKGPWAGHRKTGDNFCAGRRYSAREHICCQNSLQKRQGLRPACCGTLSFDFVFSLCCNGKVTPRTAGRPFC